MSKTDSSTRLTINPELNRRIDLSIIIVSYNTKNLLRNCLESVSRALLALRQPEVFVVDNASRDKSVQMVREEFGWVKLILNRKNLGFSRANNIALRRARGQFVLLLNPDTVVFEDSFLEVLKYMRQNPEVGITTCRVELPTGAVDRDCHRAFPTPWNSLTHFLKLGKVFPRSRFFAGYRMGFIDEDKIQEIDACAGAYMMIRREVLEEIGLLDEDYFFYGEDLDFCFRAKQAGFRVVYFPSVRIIHYKGASSGMKKSSLGYSQPTREAKRRAITASIEAMKIFYQKHYYQTYPSWVSFLVNLGIGFLGRIRSFKA